jgi:hypothetical protein
MRAIHVDRYQVESALDTPKRPEGLGYLLFRSGGICFGGSRWRSGLRGAPKLRRVRVHLGRGTSWPQQPQRGCQGEL